MRTVEDTTRLLCVVAMRRKGETLHACGYLEYVVVVAVSSRDVTSYSNHNNQRIVARKSSSPFTVIGEREDGERVRIELLEEKEMLS